MQTKNTRYRRLSIRLAATLVFTLLQANVQAFDLGASMLKPQATLALPTDTNAFGGTQLLNV